MHRGSKTISHLVGTRFRLSGSGKGDLETNFEKSKPPQQFARIATVREWQCHVVVLVILPAEFVDTVIEARKFASARANRVRGDPTATRTCLKGPERHARRRQVGTEARESFPGANVRGQHEKHVFP